MEKFLYYSSFKTNADKEDFTEQILKYLLCRLFRLSSTSLFVVSFAILPFRKLTVSVLNDNDNQVPNSKFAGQELQIRDEKLRFYPFKSKTGSSNLFAMQPMIGVSAGKLLVGCTASSD